MKPIHVYCMPGMAASPKIFEYLKLPMNFQTHLLSWIPPLKDEPIGKYAKRMSTRIIFENPILLGVSFENIGSGNGKAHFCEKNSNRFKY